MCCSTGTPWAVQNSISGSRRGSSHRRARLWISSAANAVALFEQAPLELGQHCVKVTRVRRAIADQPVGVAAHQVGRVVVPGVPLPGGEFAGAPGPGRSWLTTARRSNLAMLSMYGPTAPSTSAIRHIARGMGVHVQQHLSAGPIQPGGKSPTLPITHAPALRRSAGVVSGDLAYRLRHLRGVLVRHAFIARQQE